MAVAAVLALVLWPVEIHTAFGLPAHPLIIHVPVIFIPILGLAAIALALWPKLAERFLLPVAAFSVVTMAATFLAVGAGEAFQEDRAKNMPGGGAVLNPTLADHEDAGEALRLTMILLTLRARRVAVLAALAAGGDDRPAGADRAAGRDRDLLRDPHRPSGREARLGPRGRAGRPPGSRAARTAAARRRVR